MRPNPTVAVLAALLAALPTFTSPAYAQDPPPPAPTQPGPNTIIRDQLGLEFAVFTSKLRRSIISTDSPWGFSIRKVVDGSLAAAAGLQKGVIVLEIGGKPLRQVQQLADVLKAAKPGDVIVLKCSRRMTAAERRARPGRAVWTDFKVELRLPEPKKRSV